MNIFHCLSVSPCPFSLCVWWHRKSTQEVSTEIRNCRERSSLFICFSSFFSLLWHCKSTKTVRTKIRICHEYSSLFICFSSFLHYVFDDIINQHSLWVLTLESVLNILHCLSVSPPFTLCVWWCCKSTQKASTKIRNCHKYSSLFICFSYFFHVSYDIVNQQRL